ncbi:hypothetical protein [Mesorhizobium captivum]|uniref:hypothetical protein n=1 Tax=Mesorhizobium captivum TaxID=3072319 RepID=UPI002A246AE5|nr:hypothetical protein [Mesorhizobium sp. VK23E]MDX8515866.1 hypothetical protein [Mesorhizobium sp. VK23E]
MNMRSPLLSMIAWLERRFSSIAQAHKTYTTHLDISQDALYESRKIAVVAPSIGANIEQLCTITGDFPEIMGCESRSAAA